jgi:glycine/D-amino acid oxidase-like deaminating enzyme
MSENVIIAGAGIIGASIAWHLARGGAQVTVVDKGQPGGIATPKSWAWINASWGHPEHYVRLRMRAMEEWRRMDGVVPGLEVDWCGALMWALEGEENLQSFVAERQAQGYDIRLVEREEAAALEPALAHPPKLAAHSPAEGAIEPLEATQAILADAEHLGARLIMGNGVERLLAKGEQVMGVRLADRTEVAADRVVLAAGSATVELAAQVGVDVPVDDTTGLLIVTEPVEPILNGLIVGPGLELRQLRDGRLLGSGHYAGSDPGSDPQATADGLFETVQREIKGSEGLKLGGYAIGHRPMPRNGLPVVGEVAPGLHVAVMHSGVTLAPAIGRFMAEEILTGRRDPLIEPFGLKRAAA